MTPHEPSGNAPATYLIGVDTGGTYTDAAIIEARGHRVIATAKAITTKTSNTSMLEKIGSIEW